jgi:hypothetical protein
MFNLFCSFRVFISSFKKCFFLGFILLALLFFAGWWCFFKTSSNYFLIPVHIDTYWGVPLIEVEIGKKNYPIQLDLGSRLSSLDGSDLSEIDKTIYGKFYGFDLHGNTYENVIYQVSDVKIHNFPIPIVKICEESPEFVTNSVFYGKLDKISNPGRIGREVFDGKNFLLDFSRSRIILCNSFKDLKRDHYKLENFVKVSFHINQNGICFQVDTDVGMKTLVLDTGSSCSIVKESFVEKQCSTESLHGMPMWWTKKFILGGFDFGCRNLGLFHISSDLTDMDGILGMDFLKEYAVYIDTGQSIAYIGKSSGAVLQKKI